MISDLDKLCDELEQQELESSNRTLSPSDYAQLLAIYLYQNDLSNAKYLWKRMPQTVTSSNPELVAIWAVGQKMWKKDLPGTYQALSAFNWTEPIANIMRSLEEKVRERTVNLIGRAYSSMSLDSLAAMTGLSKDAALQICRDCRWTISEDGSTIRPIPQPILVPAHTSSEDQLFQLTEFVSFLEN